MTGCPFVSHAPLYGPAFTVVRVGDQLHVLAGESIMQQLNLIPSAAVAYSARQIRERNATEVNIDQKTKVDQDQDQSQRQKQEQTQPAPMPMMPPPD